MTAPAKSKAKAGIRVVVNFSSSVVLFDRHVHWTPRGVSLMTKWPFAQGTEVEFGFEHAGEKHCCIGVVVACHPLRRPAGYYETVLYFIEVPCQELQKAACDCRLSKEKKARSRALSWA